jgi:hypothetical protein
VDVSSSVFYRSFHRIASIRQHGRRTAMKGYVITKRGRYYAVIQLAGSDDRPRWAISAPR